MDKTLSELGKLIKPDNIDTGDISYYGEVKSKVIEDDKVVAYNVQIGDSIIEARRTCGANVGDIVLCTTLNNGLTVVSGKLDGDADVEAAQEAAAEAAASAEYVADLVNDVIEDMEDIVEVVDDARQAAQEAITAATNAQQHFWFTESGGDNGAHITEMDREDFLAHPDQGGSNLIATSNGVAVRNGLTENAVFTASGSRIGKSTEARLQTDYHSIIMYDKSSNAVFHVSDLKDTTGWAEVTEQFRVTLDMCTASGGIYYPYCALTYNSSTGVYSECTHLYYFDPNTQTQTDILNNGATVTFSSTHNSWKITITDTTSYPEGTLLTICYTTQGNSTRAFSFCPRNTNGRVTVGPDSATFGYSAAIGARSFAQGSSFAWGNSSVATGDSSAIGDYSHSEGQGTYASGDYSHAEGSETTASGGMSHAEGNGTTASSRISHAEGYFTTASGAVSHAEGNQTEARHPVSHAEGFHTQTGAAYQTVVGIYNDPTNTVSGTDDLFVVGNGNSSATRNNAFTVNNDGDVYIDGDLTVNGSISGSSDVGTIESKSLSTAYIGTNSTWTEITLVKNVANTDSNRFYLPNGTWIISYTVDCGAGSGTAPSGVTRLGARLYDKTSNTGYTSSANAHAIPGNNIAARPILTGTIPVLVNNLSGGSYFSVQMINGNAKRDINVYFRAIRIA